MNEKQLIAQYNIIADKCRNIPNSIQALKSLSDNELEIFIAGKTYQYGRGLMDSLRNAKIHMQNKKLAIETFCIADKDSFVFKI
jgi:hypothetical protein